MTNDFLQLARLEEGAYQMRREPLELDRLVAQVVDDFSSLALAEGVDLGAEVEPGSALVGDPERLVQALTNLVGNAVKFTPSGGRVRVHSRRDGRQIELSVEDTGPGIPRDLQPIIFERYVQAEEADRAGGSGLGLMIVREIVEAHQGTVGVESEPGRGSRFWMRFPAEARRGAEDRPPVAP